VFSGLFMVQAEDLCLAWTPQSTGHHHGELIDPTGFHRTRMHVPQNRMIKDGKVKERREYHSAGALDRPGHAALCYSCLQVSICRARPVVCNMSQSCWDHHGKPWKARNPDITEVVA
jgi:hypothetical protein